MKFYVENGFNKRVISSKTALSAAKNLISYLIKGDPERCEFSPVVVVSEQGFLDDLVEIGTPDDVDKSILFSVTTILDSLKRKDISRDLKKKFSKKDKIFLSKLGGMK